ncbi:MAG: prolipoprotein diacylglyceryl transferase [Anaerolineales bacterium]|nr:MAG: prolipoprotein diacylglyceryl transferase [Anaerolineales bacterium]
MTPPFGPMIFAIGNYGIHWYGLIIVVGILLGARVATYQAKSAGLSPDTIWDMLLIVVVTAVIGARVYHVFSSPSNGLIGWEYYKHHPIETLYIWQGGLGIYGAIIGGAIGVGLFCWRRKLNPLQWLDILAPGMALGQAIGRWGNYMNQELYGPPTTLPWGLRITPENRILAYADLNQYPVTTLFHPTFLYESLGALLVCLVLIWIADRFRNNLLHGDMLLLYLAGYSIVRFFTEFLRPDAWMAGALAAAQIFALVSIGFSLLVLLIRHTLHRRTVKGQSGEDTA